MTTKLLTDRFIETVKPPKTDRDVYSDAHPRGAGLELIVFASGKKSWSVRYRVKRERKRTGAGMYPAIGLAEARARCLAIANAAMQGVDLPKDEREAEDAKKRGADQPATTGEAFSRYIASYCKPNLRRWRMVERVFEMHITPALGSKSLAELRRADIVELLDDLQNGKGFGGQTNRVRGLVCSALNWCVEREWIDTNPALGIKRRKVEKPRERVLSNDELRAVWKATDRLGEPGRSFVKALILSGQRRDEIRCMTWGEIDEKGRAWTLPAKRNKGKRDHTLPLPDALLDLVAAMPKRGPFVFSLDGKRAYGGAARFKTMLENESGVTGWTLHDIRRTVRTKLAELRIPEEVAERIMNHAKKGLVGTYNRHRYDDEMRAALTTLAEHMAFIVSDARDAANVYQLPAARAG